MPGKLLFLHKNQYIVALRKEIHVGLINNTKQLVYGYYNIPTKFLTHKNLNWYSQCMDIGTYPRHLEI